MKKGLENTLKIIAVILGASIAVHCSSKTKVIGSAANTKPQTDGPDANTGVGEDGQFLNPDAELIIYDPPAPTKKVREFFSHTSHGVDLPDEKRTRTLTIKDKKTKKKRDIECSDCHRGECRKGRGVDINRPGHDSCSGFGTCHPNFASDRRMCKSCHIGNTASFQPPLRPYGTADLVTIKDYGFDYDHTSHLGPDGRPSLRNKPEATCNTCHKIDRKGRNMSQAGHKECGTCHCDDDAMLKMNDCKDCHTGTENARSGHSYLDYRAHAQQFMHKDHLLDEKGRKADCVNCHVGIADSTTIAEISVPPMLGCLQSCHDGAHKTPSGKKIFDGWVECSKCHAKTKKQPKSRKIKRK